MLDAELSVSRSLLIIRLLLIALAILEYSRRPT
jgi:hypothetical protein